MNHRQQTPVYMFWKDLNSNYLGCNAALAAIAGLSSVDHIRGKSDFDLPWAESDAQLYREGDQAVLDGCIQSNVIEPLVENQGNQLHILISKLPLVDGKGQKIGIVGSFTEISTPIKILEKFDSRHILSQRQFDCLLLVARGMSCKEIAKTINLSHRTVEYYISIIKDKLRCKSRSELIRKALTFDDIKENL